MSVLYLSITVCVHMSNGVPYYLHVHSFASTKDELHDFAPDKEPLLSMLEGDVQPMYMCKPGKGISLSHTHTHTHTHTCTHAHTILAKSIA